MDRASMRWLSRQPGRTIAERAGSDQRILATVRKEDFNTLENRVTHAYVRLASAVAREWMRENARARSSARYHRVATFDRTCKSLARDLQALGVDVAPPDSPSNYVLDQDRSYRGTRDAWRKLLAREKVLDDLWAWQAQSWTDFCVLAITLAIDTLPNKEVVFQSPVLWQHEARLGRWFDQDRPLAVYWLHDIDRIVEIQSRPENPSSLLVGARAHVALRITDPAGSDPDRRVAIWTPHAMERLDLGVAVKEAGERLEQLQQVSSHEIMRHGLILTPGHYLPETARHDAARSSVSGIALDASGDGLSLGLEALASFVSRELGA